MNYINEPDFSLLYTEYIVYNEEGKATLNHWIMHTILNLRQKKAYEIIHAAI